MTVGSARESARVPYAALTLCGVAFVVCGSLAPYQFQTMPAGEVLGRFVQELWANARIDAPSDLLANILLTFPIGFCAAGGRRPRSSAWSTIGVVLGIAATGMFLSLSMEFAQTFLPERVVSLKDVFAQTSGWLAGALGFVWLGDRLTDRLSGWARGRYQLSTEQVWLLGYVGLLAVWQLTPMDLSLSPSSIFHKYREGRLVTGLSLGEPRTAGLAAAAAGILIYMPVGTAAALLWRPRGHRRALPVTIALALLAVAAIELSHLFVESRSIDVQAGLLAGIGALAGALCATGISWDAVPARVPAGFRPALLSSGWLAAVLAFEWYPFNFVSDSAEVLARIHKLSSPSAVTADTRAIGALAVAFLLTLPLGVCVRPAFGRASRVHAAAVAALAVVAAGFWSVVEIGAALLPAGSAHLAQVPAAACGVAVGLWLGSASLRAA